MILDLPFPENTVIRLVEYLKLRKKYNNKEIDNFRHFDWDSVNLLDAEIADYVDRTDYLQLILNDWFRYYRMNCLAPISNLTGVKPIYSSFQTHKTNINSDLVLFLSRRKLLGRYLIKILYYLSSRVYSNSFKYYTYSIISTINCLGCFRCVRPRFYRIYQLIDLHEFWSKISISDLMFVLSHGIFGGPNSTYTKIYLELIDIAWERTNNRLQIMDISPYLENLQMGTQFAPNKLRIFVPKSSISYNYYDSESKNYQFSFSPWLHFRTIKKKILKLLSDDLSIFDTRSTNTTFVNILTTNNFILTSLIMLYIVITDRY